MPRPRVSHVDGCVTGRGEEGAGEPMVSARGRASAFQHHALLLESLPGLPRQYLSFMLAKP